jgi:hypothetical protein
MHEKQAMKPASQWRRFFSASGCIRDCIIAAIYFLLFGTKEADLARQWRWPFLKSIQFI